MESLLCDEVWLSSPETADCCDHERPPKKRSNLEKGVAGSGKEECNEVNIMCLEKELSYMPEPGYLDYLQSDNNLMQYRSRAIKWFIKSRSRFNLSFGTVFNAANYFDRFMSMNQYQGWSHWMIELLSVACLSVASKFTEISPSSLMHEIQIMEDLDYSYQSNTIKRMELTLLHTLGWRLNSTTTYSYVELLISNLESLDSNLLNQLTTQLTNLLLGSILDIKLLEYRPSVVAVSALWRNLDELNIPSTHAHLACVTRQFNQDQKDDVVKCHTIMMKSSQGVDPLCELIVSSVCGQQPCWYWPSSPVTVLLREKIDIYDFQVDLSIFNNIPAHGSSINPESAEKRRKK